MFLATGKYRIERGSGENGFGDEVDGDEVVARGVLLALTEKERRQSGSENFVRERVVLGRGGPKVDIREGDRVVDERTDEKFAVQKTTRPGAVPVMGSDVRFECTRISVDAVSS